MSSNENAAPVRQNPRQAHIDRARAVGARLREKIIAENPPQPAATTTPQR